MRQETVEKIERLLPRYIIILTVIISCSVMTFFPKWTVDDAYISFRYSENLVKHGELNWNPGDNPVEGYTGIALPLLISAGIEANISPVTFSHILGIASFYICGLFIFLILKRINLDNLIISLIILFYSTTPFLYTNVFSGLETMMFTAAFTAAIYFSIIILNKKNTKSVQLIFYMASLLFLSLIRPEGVLISVLLLFFLSLQFAVSHKKSFKKFVIIAFTGFGIPFIMYFLWRWNYYGQFFPNTYYLKTGGSLFSYGSYNSLLSMLKDNLLVPFVAAFFFALLNLDNFWQEVKEERSKVLSKELLTVILAGIIAIVIISWQYLYTDLLMNFSHRFWVPFLPVLFILFAILADIGFKNYKLAHTKNPISFKVYSFILILLIVIQTGKVTREFKSEVNYSWKMKNLIENVHVKTGQYIHQHFKGKYTLLVHADAGAIPFYAKLRTIDFGGLNDEYLSHKSDLSKKQIVDYFFDCDADVLAITSFRPDKIERSQGSLNWETLKLVISDPRFKEYSIVKKFGTPMWNYYEFVFVKNSLAQKLVKKRI